MVPHNIEVYRVREIHGDASDKLLHFNNHRLRKVQRESANLVRPAKLKVNIASHYELNHLPEQSKMMLVTTQCRTDPGKIDGTE